MKRMSLGELLQAADTPSEEPSNTPSEMAAGVRRRRRKQVRRRLAAVSFVAMIGAAATVWSVLGSAGLRPGETPVAKPKPPSDNLPSQQAAVIARSVDAHSIDTDEVLRQLRQQQAERESRLAMLLDVEREFLARAKLREIRRRIATTRPVTPVAEQTAILLLASADLKLRHYGLPKSAADDYRRVIELFPMSSWASSATKRLDEMMR